MINETYSAGLISQSFWFIEMKKIVKLIADGKTEEEIKKICIEENLFGAAKEYRAKRIYGYIWNRTKQLDEKMIDLFINSDLATQKLINLVAILKSDRLFVIKRKLIFFHFFNLHLIIASAAHCIPLLFCHQNSTRLTALEGSNDPLLFHLVNNSGSTGVTKL